ncbi:MAG: LamG domain-containing protein [candidate division WS1 bacterium]|jgi:hypothetical protein|nr:LamG domain-containing protein [candidate division WS1 bacterium]
MRRWQITAIILGIILAIPLIIGAAVEDAVAVWTFNGQVRRFERDVSGNDHHALAQDDYEHIESPGLQAVVFDGVDDYLVVPNDPALVATDALTVDVWLRVDSLEGGPQCIVDKRGERYRLHIMGGAPSFGLKSDEARMDLSGGQLTPGQWHRITGVFDRPNASLYVDGEKVAEREWDNQIGPGGDLIFGSKSGVTDFFAGAIDEIRIYDFAQAPQPDETPSSEPIGVGTMADAVLQVQEVAGGMRVDTGPAVYELTDAGGLRAMTIGGESVMDGNDRPLLSATAFESATYDGWRDCAQGTTVTATWRPGEPEYDSDAEGFSASYTGSLDFGGGDTINCELSLEARRGNPFMTATVSLDPSGAFNNRFIRDVSLRLPLSLNDRKRVVQAADRGIQWNTRYFYQFHVSPTQRLLNEPDHNIWRRFAIDQNSATDYHLWKAESPGTPSLTMQRGEQAPGWMAAYDEQAGIIFAYRGLADRAPKSLRIEAEGSGEAQVSLWHEGLPALAINSPQAEAVFGDAHTVDFAPFTDEFTFAQPDLALATHWGVESLASDPPGRNELPMGGINPMAEESAEDEAPLITGGVPLPRGAVSDPANVRLQRDGADVPLQTKIVGYWPDDSIMWLLLTFPAEGGAVQGAAGTGDEMQFDVTRRDGSREEYTLLYGGDCAAGTPAQTLTATQDGETVRINTGDLQLELAAQQGWLRSATLGGRAMLSGPGGSFVDWLRTEPLAYKSMTTHADGALDPGAFVPETIELEEAGPLRAIVKLVGATTAQDSPRMVLRLEAYAGRSCARVEQSMEFLHPDPRIAFVRRMGLELPLADAGGTITAGGQGGPVALAGGRRAGLRQHSHLGYTAWSQAEGERFLRVDEANGRSRGWLDVAGANGGVTMLMRDMWQNFPNELAVDTEAGTMTAYFWPESGPLMDVRRYSNYPHRSQGESTPSDSSWVPDQYYQNDPVIGVTKTHELLIEFHEPEMTPATIDAMAGDFQRRPLVYCGADWYLATETIPPQPAPDDPAFERMNANIDHYARFWMHHQQLWGWYGMWDYGDVQHAYKAGYGWIVPPDTLAEYLADPPENYEDINVSAVRIQDYRAPIEWCYDNGRWGWTNTEGLPGLLLQMQYLRTGDRDLFFISEAMARHVRDVDMRHAGMWFGRGTRHGVQHWSDGNHEERQTTHSEFRHHYFLTGEPRSRDFARLLYDEWYSTTTLRIHAAHSGRTQGLLTWWLMTGDDETARMLDSYMDAFSTPEGIDVSPEVSFPDAVCHSNNEVNGGTMFFWHFGAGHALLDYYELTQHEALRQALIATADFAMAQPRPSSSYVKAVAFAARYADNPAPYREYLSQQLATDLIYHQVVPHNREVYGGPRGTLRGGVSGSLFSINQEAYMMAGLDAEPALAPEVIAAMEQIDQNGGAPYNPGLLSWQSGYDRPDLAEYLRIKHPQP